MVNQPQDEADWFLCSFNLTRRLQMVLWPSWAFFKAGKCRVANGFVLYYWLYIWPVEFRWFPGIG